MWRSAIVLSMVGLMAAGFAAGQELQPPYKPEELMRGPLSPRTARECFAEAKALVQAENGRLWGVSLDGPLMLVDPATREIATSQADAEEILKERRGVFMGALPESVPVAGTVTEWAGVTWVMLPWPLPKDLHERQRMYAHEMFHRVQEQIGLPRADADNRHLDTRDGRVWLRMEWRALAKALGEDGLKRTQALSDALLFRAHRWSLFADAATNERAMEMHEGMAEYTGICTACPRTEDAVAMTLANIERAEQWPAVVFGFAYASGPAYGVLLDEYFPCWRAGLTPEHDLGLMLQEALLLEIPEETGAAALERAEQYGYKRVAYEEDRRQQARAKREEQYQQRFVDGPVLTMQVRDMQFQFDPRAVEAWGTHGRVYPTLKLTDVWGTLEVFSGGALIKQDWTMITVPAPEQTEGRFLRGDGWRLRLRPGWSAKAGERTGDFVVGK